MYQKAEQRIANLKQADLHDLLRSGLVGLEKDFVSARFTPHAMERLRELGRLLSSSKTTAEHEKRD